MKKKTIKKLELAKETVRSLERTDLEQIAGAGWTDTCNNLTACHSNGCFTRAC
jgi:hypothetical protein